MNRIVLLMLLAFPAVGAAQSLTGEYVNEGPQGRMHLSLSEDRGQVGGSLLGVDGSRGQIQATIVEPGRAVGSIVLSGVNAWFFAGVDGDSLIVLLAELDPQTGEPELDQGWQLAFRPTGAGRAASTAAVGAGAPMAGAPPATAPPAPSPSAYAPAPTPAGWAREQTILGQTVHYPAGWQAMREGLTLVLIPGDAARDDQGRPMEAFIVGFETVLAEGGATDPVDPRLLAQYDQAIQGVGLSRVGEPERLPSTAMGQSALLTYEGSPGGQTVQQRYYFALNGNNVYFIMHMARKDLIAKREAEARRIFAGMTLGTPVIDPDLVGGWSRESTSGSTGGGGSVYSSTYSNYYFEQDGTVTYGSSSSVSGTVPGLSAHSRGDPNTERGRWAAADRQLVILWDDGQTSTFEYNVFPHSGSVALKLQTPGSNSPSYYNRR